MLVNDPMTVRPAGETVVSCSTTPPAAAAAETGQQVIRLGSLFAIADQIQALCLARKTAEIRITNLVPPGRINIVHGTVVHAQCGSRTGLEAAIELINLVEPESEIEPDRPARMRTVTLPYPQILLEAANRQDETALPRARPTAASRPPADQPDRARPQLWVMLGNQSLDCSLPTGLTLLGRSTLSDIVLADQTVSKRHACLEVLDQEVILRDLNSTNGTFVEGQRVSEARLRGRTRLRFGNVSAVLQTPPAAAE